MCIRDSALGEGPGIALKEFLRRGGGTLLLPDLVHQGHAFIRHHRLDIIGSSVNIDDLKSGRVTAAVSYTHLDVYKRQFYVYAFFQKEGGEGVAACVRGDGFVDAGSPGLSLIHI